MTYHMHEGKTNTIVSAILRTLIYSDIFDFPLTDEEIWYFLKNNKRISKQEYLRSLQRLPKLITKQHNYYSITSRKQLINGRKTRQRISQAKITIAEKTVLWLKMVPSIRFIGISGSVAGFNAKDSDDIDLFVIVSHNTIWITRLLTLFILQLLGKRRTRNCRQEKNKICLNMLMDENNLLLPKDRQDLYTAHEIAQMYPLFDRNNTYSRFIFRNKWILQYMPNISPKKCIHQKNFKEQNNKVTERLQKVFLKSPPFLLLESIAQQFQLWLINKNRTQETISRTLLAFHPYDYRPSVMSLYNKKLKEFKVE